MAFLDGWLADRPRNHARDAKLYLVLSYGFGILAFALFLTAARESWELTWRSLFLPALMLAGSIQAYAQALDSRRAHQMARQGPAPPSV